MYLNGLCFLTLGKETYHLNTGAFLPLMRDHSAVDGLVQVLTYNFVNTISAKYLAQHRQSSSQPQEVSRFLEEVDTKRVLTALRKVESYAVPKMLEYGQVMIDRYEMTCFSHNQIGRKALIEMGFAPYQFVSAWFSIAIMIYFGEPVMVHEPFPLKSFYAERLENRNPLNQFFVEIGNIIMKMDDGHNEEDLERIVVLLNEGLKLLKSFSIECAKGKGVSFKRMVMDATAKGKGLSPALFDNKLYQRLC